jgi:hypothetical protein
VQLDSGKDTIMRLRLELQREGSLAESGQPAESAGATGALKERIQQVPLPAQLFERGESEVLADVDTGLERTGTLSDKATANVCRFYFRFHV